MNELLVVGGVVALLALITMLWRIIARDGYGSNVLPRSHSAELGSWAGRQLRR